MPTTYLNTTQGKRPARAKTPKEAKKQEEAMPVPIRFKKPKKSVISRINELLLLVKEPKQPITISTQPKEKNPVKLAKPQQKQPPKVQTATKGIQTDTVKEPKKQSNDVNSLDRLIRNEKALQAELEAMIDQNEQLQNEHQALRDENEKLKALLVQMDRRIEELKRTMETDRITKRELYNKIIELKGNIRVAVRIRPPVNAEACQIKFDESVPGYMESSHFTVLGEMDEYKGLIVKSPDGTRSTKYQFDKVFGASMTQKDVFDEVSEFIQSAINGYSVNIFAYGQTGSGKTYTVHGDKGERRGIVPRAIEFILDAISELGREGWMFRLNVAMFEIYKESIYDLLVAGQKPLKVMTNPETRQPHVEGLTYYKITSLAQILPIYTEAIQRRVTATTDMNKTSSRSHCIFQLNVIATNRDIVKTGQLNLVDLAGSERLKRSNVSDQRREESITINSSLSALGHVISMLAKKSEYIPYRDSVLTHVLQPALSPGSKTMVLVTISPTDEDLQESINSLRFAVTTGQCSVGTAQRNVTKK